MTSAGQLTVNFEPRVKFPAYMLATHNQSSEGRRRNLIHKSTVISKQEHEEVFVIKSIDNILLLGVMGGYDYLNDPYFKDDQFDDDLKKSKFKDLEDLDGKIKEIYICKAGEVWDPEEEQCIAQVDEETEQVEIQEEPDLDYYFGDLQKLISVGLLREVDVGKYTHENVPFKVTSLSREKMTLDLEFSDPGSITVYDKLEATVNFQDFDANYKNGTAYKQFMTPQESATSEEDSGIFHEGAKTTMQAAVVGSTALNLLMNGALSQVWGMINGL